MTTKLCPFRKEKRTTAEVTNGAHIPILYISGEEFLPCIGKECAAFMETDDEKEKFLCKIIEGDKR